LKSNSRRRSSLLSWLIRINNSRRNR
jgi:hypothetical protein